MGKPPRGHVPPAAERRHDLDRFSPRRAFCQAIQRCTPGVLEDLHAAVFQKVGRRLLERRSHQHLEGAAADPDEQEHVLEQLQPALGEWEFRWHLTGRFRREAAPDPIVSFLGWIEHVAVLPTLIEWACGRKKKLIAWADIPTRGGITELEQPDPATILFTIPGWALLRETRDAFRKRAEASFKTELASYIESRQAMDPEWQLGNRDLPVRHFDFLVQHQVVGRSRVQIGKEFRATRNTVAGGINEAAEEVIGVGWEDWLMPNNPGGRRPRF